MKKIIIILFILTLATYNNVRAQEPVSTRKILIVAINNAGPNKRLPHLYGVKAEGDSIMKISNDVERMYLTGEDATLDNLVSSLKDPLAILHISGHGFTINNDLVMPLYSEEPLFLADDKNHLNNNAIFDVSNLKDYNPHGIDLVVLSTSHSYMPSVIEALKEAKVKSCLLTGWAVDDEVTQILMTNFYKNYLGGMSKQQALREAQKAVRETPGFSDPEYWAAFILLEGLN